MLPAWLPAWRGPFDEFYEWMIQTEKGILKGERGNGRWIVSDGIKGGFMRHEMTWKISFNVDTAGVRE